MSKSRRVPIGRRLWQPVLRFFVWLVLRIEVRGEEHVPADGGGIIYYNHIHWLDPPLVCATSRRYVIPLTKIEASRFPLVGLLLRWYHVIFITRGAVDRAALRATAEVLQAGDISVISPEGTRSADGRLQSAKDGLAFIARLTPDVWLIPCAVTGTPAFGWSLAKLLKRPRVILTYGRPFRFRWPSSAQRTGRDVLRAMTDEAMIEMAAILPAEMRGDYDCVGEQPVQWLEFI